MAKTQMGVCELLWEEFRPAEETVRLSRELSEEMRAFWRRLWNLLRHCVPWGKCRICGYWLDQGHDAILWSKHLEGWVDVNCIPAWVRRRGVYAVRDWLALGEVLISEDTVRRSASIRESKNGSNSAISVPPEHLTDTPAQNGNSIGVEDSS
jgi:hypothetical protein